MPLEISSLSWKLPAIANGRISRVSKRTLTDAHMSQRGDGAQYASAVVPEASRAITLT